MTGVVGEGVCRGMIVREGMLNSGVFTGNSSICGLRVISGSSVSHDKLLEAGTVIDASGLKGPVK